jgi:hypothetical protein
MQSSGVLSGWASLLTGNFGAEPKLPGDFCQSMDPMTISICSLGRGGRQAWDRSHKKSAEQRDELATPHSITSSALASNVAGTVRPSILAV